MDALRGYVETSISYFMTAATFASPIITSRTVRWLIGVHNPSILRVWNGVDFVFMGFLTYSCSIPFINDHDASVSNSPVRKVVVWGIARLGSLMMINGIFHIVCGLGSFISSSANNTHFDSLPQLTPRALNIRANQTFSYI